MPKQSRSKAIKKPRRIPQQRKPQYSRLVEFPEAGGLTVEKVALSTDSDFHPLPGQHRPNRGD